MSREKHPKKRKSRTEWAEDLALWERSGLTQSAYCKKYKLDPETFSAWKTKLKEQARDLSFVEIAPGPGSQNVEEEAIELVLDGIRIKLRESIDPIKLRNIVLALVGV